MFKMRECVAVPVQEHRQIVVNICLCEIVRKLLKIQYSLGNLQAVIVDSTVRILSQAELLCEKRNSFFEFRNGLNGLVQNRFVHNYLVQGANERGSEKIPAISLHFK